MSRDSSISTAHVAKLGEAMLALIGSIVVLKKAYSLVDISHTRDKLEGWLLSTKAIERVPILGSHVAKRKMQEQDAAVEGIRTSISKRGGSASSDQIVAHRQAQENTICPPTVLSDREYSLFEIAEMLGISREMVLTYQDTHKLRVEKDILVNRYGTVGAYTSDPRRYAISSMVNSCYAFYSKERLPELLEKRAQLINWIGNLLRSPQGHPIYGITTAGPGFSAFESVQAHMQNYLKSHPRADRRKLSVVGSVDTHESFKKACLSLGVNFVSVPVTSERVVNIEAMKKSCRSFGAFIPIMFVANKVSYPYGTTDNIREIAKLAKELGAGCHLDMSYGSIFTPQTDEEVALDYPGVTAVSFSPGTFCEVESGGEGASVVIFSNKDLQLAACRSSAWLEMDSLVDGVSIAKAYYTMLSIGAKGYSERGEEILRISNNIVRTIKLAISGLIGDGELSAYDFYIVGNPTNALICFSGRLSFAVASLLSNHSYDPSSIEYETLEFSQIKPTEEQLWFQRKNCFNLNMLNDGFNICISMLHARTVGIHESFTDCIIKALRVCNNHPKFSRVFFKTKEAEVGRAVVSQYADRLAMTGFTMSQLMNTYVDAVDNRTALSDKARLAIR